MGYSSKVFTIVSLMVCFGFSHTALAHRVVIQIGTDLIPVHLTKDLTIVKSKQKGGKTFHVKRATVLDDGNEYDLADYGEWRVSAKATELVIQIGGGLAKTEVQLPKPLLERLLSLLKESPTKTQCNTDFDCACFVTAAHGRRFEDISWRSDSGTFYTKMHEEEYWNIESADKNKIKPKDLSPGDVIRLFKENQNGKEEQHFALSLGEGLFISKFGGSGIYITDLKGFEAVYPYPNLEVWRPSPEGQCEIPGLNPKPLLRICVITMCALFWLISGQ